jgi:hypothetical protein
MIKILVLGAMVVSALASAGSASAANWTSNGPIANYTATAPAAKLAIASPSNPLTICTNVSSNGNLNGPTGPVNTGPWNTGNASPKFASCTIAGLVATVACSTTANLNAVSQAGTVVTGTLSSISCTITRGACVITVTGSVPTDYDNSTGVLTVKSAGQSLAASAPGACNSITGFTAASGGNATAQFGSNTTPIGNLAYTVTSSPIPNIQHN